MHFLRRVEIRAIRFFVDYTNDESYTPTNIIFYAGTGHHDLIQFAELNLHDPMGWQDVPIADVGGGHDGHSLACWVVQIHVKENHQNGKDTHIRGIKVYALDESGGGAGGTGGPGGATSLGDNGVLREMSAHIEDAANQRLMAELGLEETRDSLFQQVLGSVERRHGGAPLEAGFSTSDLMRDPEIR